MAQLSDNTDYPTYFRRSLGMSDNPCCTVGLKLNFSQQFEFFYGLLEAGLGYSSKLKKKLRKGQLDT